MGGEVTDLAVLVEDSRFLLAERAEAHVFHRVCPFRIRGGAASCSSLFAL